ncbi:hypothetical protein [Nonomuraea typhae]|uniref:hypothetical protein n=1 Tax=Nonomuraea typhae TaxID=2603600 RepID=UPI0012FAEEA1|nr:hypothetical protein [Nonomuraea typhae]
MTRSPTHPAVLAAGDFTMTVQQALAAPATYDPPRRGRRLPEHLHGRTLSRRRTGPRRSRGRSR